MPFGLDPFKLREMGWREVSSSRGPGMSPDYETDPEWAEAQQHPPNPQQRLTSIMDTWQRFPNVPSRYIGR